MTLLFSVKAYEQVALAYIAGLERRLAAGQRIDGIASVASFFVSRVDTAVDALLPDSSPLRGKAAIANAKIAYRTFKRLFSGPRWERLAAAGARVQRPLWASTGTKNPSYSDVMYVEGLIGADTVNTMPESTLHAFAEHGRARPALDEALDDAENTIRLLPEAGVDLDAVTAKLLDDGVAAFTRDFDKLIEAIDAKRKKIVEEEERPLVSLGTLAGPVEERLSAMAKTDVAAPHLGQRPHRLEAGPHGDHEPPGLADVAGAYDGRARRAGRLRPAGGGRRLRARRAHGHGRFQPRA